MPRKLTHSSDTFRLISSKGLESKRPFCKKKGKKTIRVTWYFRGDTGEKGSLLRFLKELCRSLLLLEEDAEAATASKAAQALWQNEGLDVQLTRCLGSANDQDEGWAHQRTGILSGNKKLALVKGIGQCEFTLWITLGIKERTVPSRKERKSWCTTSNSCHLELERPKQ
ncbi:hypothetical protein BT69DRAFT_1291982 [Atractiella rhizophila]|nr:hypothetical protein BT69DRAFT_1291982 [Atractiella rhizophila]